MARPKIDVDVRGNTKPLKRDIDKISSKAVSLDLNSKNFSAPLGKIRGELGEFDKSLAASNARVLAFGASAGAIYAIERALSETVKATIQVEKSLAEVNVILGTSQKKLAGFGNELFEIAKKTGRSFQDVSLAAGELARQGLAMSETLKRTSDAMVLARLSGLGVEESVNAITAALNGFRNAALSSTAVVDKLIAVDQAFAVSGADLAEALRRVGSTAEGAGVSLNELLGIVTAAQQITARGGAVIGNSFKTIFTRIQRPRVLEALDELGVKTKNAAGASLSATQVLKNLANTFDRLSEAQQAQIAELVGGVFQINVLKASLSDLGSQYSVFTTATEIAANASGESAKRNAQLNQTLSAGLNETLQNLTKLAAGVGKLTLEPAIKQVLGFVNAITTKLSGGDSGAEEAGGGIAKALLGGIGKFLSGPGLALAAVALIQLFNNLRKFAVDAFNTFTGLNASFKQQQQLQQGILSILQQNPKVLAQIQRGEISVDAAAQQILSSYKSINQELFSANALAGQLAQKMSAGGAQVGTVGGRDTITTKATGYVPNFADNGEVAAMALSGMYTKSQMANPQVRRGRIFDGKGGSFMASYNGHEKKQDVIGPNGKKGTIIASPAMQAAARGFVPNFSVRMKKKDAPESVLNAFDARKDKDQDWSTWSRKAGNVANAMAITPVVSLDGAAGIFTTGRSMSKEGVAQFTKAEATKLLGATNPAAGQISGLTVRGMVQGQTRAMKDQLGKDTTFDQIVESELRTPLKNITKAMLGGSKDAKDLPSPVDVWKKAAEDTSGYPQFLGRIFEAGINSVIGKAPAKSGTWDYLKGDFNAPRGQATIYKALFGSDLTRLQSASFIDAKRSGFEERATRDSVAGKISRTPTLQSNISTDVNAFLKKNKASGYVPNFVGGALRAAMGRENRANTTKSAIRIGQDRRLASGANPFGLAVTNTRDEPRGLKDVLATGYVPNFVARMAEVIDAGGAPALGGGGGGGGNVGGTRADNASAVDENTGANKEDSEKKKKSSIASEKLFGAMMLASVATSIFAAAGEDASPAMQKTTSALNSLTNGVLVTTTIMTTMTGGLGIAIAAVAGLTTALYSYFGSVKASTAAQNAALEALSENTVRLKEQGDSIQQTQAALSAYNDALKSGDARQVVAAQKKYQEALTKLEPELRRQVMLARDSNAKQAVLGKAASDTAKEGKVVAAAEQAQKDLIDRVDKTAKEKTQGAVLKVGGGILAVLGVIKGIQKIQAVRQASAEAAEKAAAAAQVTATNAQTGTLVAATQAQTAATVSAISGAAATDVAGDVAGGAVASGGVVAASGAAPVAAGAAAAAAPLIALAAAAAAVTVGMIALYDVIWGGTLAAMRDARDILKEFESKYNDPEQEGSIVRNKKTDRQMTRDAQNLNNALAGAFEKRSQQDFGKSLGELSAAEREQVELGVIDDVRKKTVKRPGMSNEDVEEAVIAEMDRLGAAAENVAPLIEGAGSQTLALILRMRSLRKRAGTAGQEVERLQQVLDQQAQAAAAAAAAIQTANLQANGAAAIFQEMAKGIVAARKQTEQFNREFSLEVLKGGSKLAAQFQTSFQQTAQQGAINKIEINERANAKSAKLREGGAKAMFDALSKQESVAALMEKVDKGGEGVTQSEQMFVNAIRTLPATISGGGAGAMMQAFTGLLNQGALPGMALEGKKVGVEGLGLEKILGEQLNAMAEAERTRQHQLRLSELQTRLAQEQNRIDQQAKAGGGIKAFLDPAAMDKMEDGFNTSLDDFVTASGRGDTVKTGQAAGALLGNLNEFMGADLMGPAADKLKDMVQGGLEQSLRGRAFARADALDQAAAETGDSSLSELADTLRNQNFAEIAATQTALEFKRQKMPDNIASMLGVQQHLESLQQEDLAANTRTANASVSMANYLVGGGFAQAVTGMAASLPPAIVPGLGATNTLLQQGANAMVAVARVIAGTEGTKQAGAQIAAGGKSRAEGIVALQGLVDSPLATNEYGHQTEYTSDRMKKLAALVTQVGTGAADELAGINALGDKERARIDPAYIKRLQDEAALATALSSGNLDATTLSNTDSLGPEVAKALKKILESGLIEEGLGLGLREGLGSTDRTISGFEGFRAQTAFGGGMNIGGGASQEDIAQFDLGRIQRARSFGFNEEAGRRSTDEEKRHNAIAIAEEMRMALNERFLKSEQIGSGISQDQVLAQLAAVDEALRLLNAGKFDEKFGDGINDGQFVRHDSLVGDKMSATVPIEIRIVNSDGSEKIERLRYDVDMIKNRQPANQAGSGMTTPGAQMVAHGGAGAGSR